MAASELGTSHDWTAVPVKEEPATEEESGFTNYQQNDSLLQHDEIKEEDDEESLPKDLSTKQCLGELRYIEKPGLGSTVNDPRQMLLTFTPLKEEIEDENPEENDLSYLDDARLSMSPRDLEIDPEDCGASDFQASTKGKSQTPQSKWSRTSRSSQVPSGTLIGKTKVLGTLVLKSKSEVGDKANVHFSSCKKSVCKYGCLCKKGNSSSILSDSLLGCSASQSNYDKGRSTKEGKRRMKMSEKLRAFYEARRHKNGEAPIVASMLQDPHLSQKTSLCLAKSITKDKRSEKETQRNKLKRKSRRLEASIKCMICSKDFNYQYSYSRHLKMHARKGDDLQSASICKKSASYDSHTKEISSVKKNANENTEFSASASQAIVEAVKKHQQDIEKYLKQSKTNQIDRESVTVNPIRMVSASKADEPNDVVVDGNSTNSCTNKTSRVVLNVPNIQRFVFNRTSNNKRDKNLPIDLSQVTKDKTNENNEANTYANLQSNGEDTTETANIVNENILLPEDCPPSTEQMENSHMVHTNVEPVVIAPIEEEEDNADHLEPQIPQEHSENVFSIEQNCNQSSVGLQQNNPTVSLSFNIITPAMPALVTTTPLVIGTPLKVAPNNVITQNTNKNSQEKPPSPKGQIHNKKKNVGGVMSIFKLKRGSLQQITRKSKKVIEKPEKSDKTEKMAKKSSVEPIKKQEKTYTFKSYTPASPSNSSPRSQRVGKPVPSGTDTHKMIVKRLKRKRNSALKSKERSKRVSLSQISSKRVDPDSGIDTESDGSDQSKRSPKAKLKVTTENTEHTQEEPSPASDVTIHTIAGEPLTVNELREQIDKQIKNRVQTELISCPVCDKKFQYPSEIRRHIMMHTNERGFKCTYCPKAFARKPHLKEHMRVHTGERPFKCKLCPAAFAQKSNLVIHNRTHTGDRPFACDTCGKRFRRQDAQNQHTMTHHSDAKPFSCAECGASFPCLRYLKDHMKCHSKEKPFKCDKCEAAFVCNKYLKLHIRALHTNVRPYKCDKCPAKFTQSGKLVEHQRIHTGERPYTCSSCGQTFVRSGHLRRHLFTHTGERPFGCELCPAKFSQRDHLKRHHKSVHS